MAVTWCNKYIGGGMTNKYYAWPTYQNPLKIPLTISSLVFLKIQHQIGYLSMYINHY